MKKQTLGMMIATLRKEQGMTQAELAEKMSVTDKAVSKWERGLSCPDVNSLPKLAEVFGISVDELMQVKEAEAAGGDKTGEMAGLVLKGITVAMGVAVTVMAIMKNIDMYSAFTMLGIGLAACGVNLLRDSGGDK